MVNIRISVYFVYEKVNVIPAKQLNSPRRDGFTGETLLRVKYRSLIIMIHG